MECITVFLFCCLSLYECVMHIYIVVSCFVRFDCLKPQWLRTVYLYLFFLIILCHYRHGKHNCIFLFLYLHDIQNNYISMYINHTYNLQNFPMVSSVQQIPVVRVSKMTPCERSLAMSMVNDSHGQKLRDKHGCDHLV